VLVRRASDNGLIGGGRCGTEPRSNGGAGKVRSTHVRNQEREIKVMKKLLETHNHEIGEMKNGNKELVVKFEKLGEVINNVMTEYKQNEHAVKKWEEKKHMVADKLVRVEDLQRKNNILIFGLEEEGNENYFDKTEAVAKFFKDTMRLEMPERSTDFTTRLGRRKGQRPILVKFTSFAMKLKMLKIPNY
jgi:hypothetical protein